MSMTKPAAVGCQVARGFLMISSTWILVGKSDPGSDPMSQIYFQPFTGVLFLLIGFHVFWAGDANALVGNQWKQLPPIGKQAYIMGVFDGWNTLRGMKEGVGRRGPMLPTY